MSAAVCDLCRERPTFYTIPLVGVVWQRCGCGEIPMRPHVDGLVDVPAELYGPKNGEHETEATVCRVCERRFLRRRGTQRNTCGEYCRRTHRRTTAHRRVTRRCRTCKARYQGRVDVPTRTCTRCRKREDMRQRRLAKIAARAA